MSLTPSQIYSVARQAGFPPDTAVKMTAIAIKESGGNPAAYNGKGPDNSYGLWQINMIGNLGPARLAQFGLSDASQLLDPLTNAKAAYAIWNGNDANLNSAWAIGYGVNQTRYQAALPTARAAADSVEGAAYVGGVGEPVITETPQTVPQTQTPSGQTFGDFLASFVWPGSGGVSGAGTADGWIDEGGIAGTNSQASLIPGISNGWLLAGAAAMFVVLYVTSD